MRFVCEVLYTFFSSHLFMKVIMFIHTMIV